MHRWVARFPAAAPHRSAADRRPSPLPMDAGLGQQTGSKRPGSGSLSYAELGTEECAKPHEQSDCASIVANSRDPRAGLSRRRSRVRVPSLPSLRLPCKRGCCVASIGSHRASSGSNRAALCSRLQIKKVPANGYLVVFHVAAFGAVGRNRVCPDNMTSGVVMRRWRHVPRVCSRRIKISATTAVTAANGTSQRFAPGGAGCGRQPRLQGGGRRVIRSRRASSSDRRAEGCQSRSSDPRE
jgi:hypothetical protein